MSLEQILDSAYTNWAKITTGNLTVVNEDVVIVDKASGAATTITLPAASATLARRMIWVVDAKGDAGTNNITVNVSGSGTIGGVSSFVIRSNFGQCLFVDVGDEWQALVPSTGSGTVANPLPPAKFTSINVTTGTLAAGNASGAAFTCLTSTNATPGSQAMRTVAQVLADTPALQVGMSYMLRITNTGAGTLTLATDASTQFTMTGTMTVPQNTFRDFVVTINTATTGTVQAVAVGTFS